MVDERRVLRVLVSGAERVHVRQPVIHVAGKGAASKNGTHQASRMAT